MPDIPGDTTTTTTITVGGGVITGTIDNPGDHDWYRINLTAGQEITVILNGTTLEDPYLYIRSSDGSLLYERDDLSEGYVRDSKISFKVLTTGTYYIDAAAFDTYTGDYQLTVESLRTPPTYTNDQIATQLVDGYWGGEERRFDLSAGRTLTYNVSGLTPDGAALAIQALGVWSDIIGVTFTEVGAGGQIIFDDDEEGAHSSSDFDFDTGIITSSSVNVSAQWLQDFGKTVGSYGFQTYLHEIGHALGLGHAGFYDGDAEYRYDALYANDSWATSVMSYFSQQEAGVGHSYAYLVTPMAADIVAAQRLYGLSATTRLGDTTYGSFGTGIYNAGLYGNNALTIYDSGGIDTLDYSTYSANQFIRLTPETFSSVGGLVFNLTIARGVVIENAIGGSGNDQIWANDAANVLIGGAGDDQLNGYGGDDTLTGGLGQDSLSGELGNDTFRDTKAGLNGDSISFFSAGDKIVFTDAALTGFAFTLTGSVLNYGPGLNLTLLGPALSGPLVATAAAGGGVQLSINTPAPPADARNDFDGDGRSDILWRNDGGTVMEWLGQANGSFTYNPSVSYNLPLDWKFAASGDFNGDGRDDALWRTGTGAMIGWLGQTNGTFAYSAAFNSSVGADWKVVGAGDFDGDKYDDILWHNTNGTFLYWRGSANGFVGNAAQYALPAGWSVVGTGDYNGDGRDDAVWRQQNGLIMEWLGQANGSFSYNPAVTYQLPNEWVYAGSGDFNGDNRDDTLWRNASSGQLMEWLGETNGTFAYNAAGSTTRPLDWHVVGTGDFNGDTFDDVMWRNDSGAFVPWLGQAGGGFSPSFASYTLPNEWHVQPDNFFV